MPTGQWSESVRCKAKSKSTGERCKRSRTPGHLVCRLHGSASPQAQAKAQERLAAQAAQAELDKAIARFQIEPVDDPLTALKMLAGEVLAWKNAIREHVHKLTALRFATDYGDQVRGEVVLFERALDRCVSVLGVIAKLNIDDRLAAVTERQAQMLEDALFSAFEAAGVTMADVDMKRAVARAFAAQLHLVG